MDALEPIAEGVRIGVDLGQKTDFTAVAVVEMQRRGYSLALDDEDDEDARRRPRGGELHYMVRHLERMPLGTSYPAVVARLVAIRRKLADSLFWVDATGLGAPVVDLLREAGLPVTAVYLTGSDKMTREGGRLLLGKALLVSRLQVLLQQRRVHLPKSTEAQALADELLVYEVHITEAAHAEYGAFKVGQHDDLVTALGLAVWGETTWLIS